MGLGKLYLAWGQCTLEEGVSELNLGLYGGSIEEAEGLVTQEGNVCRAQSWQDRPQPLPRPSRHAH